MKKIIWALLLPIIFFAATIQSWAGTVAGTVADYNAAQVRLSMGDITVPASYIVYTATATIPTGTTFVINLPAGFSFATAPALTSASATFTLVSATGSQATYTVEDSSVSSGQTITLGTYDVTGATALETITPPANALPISLQATGIDTSAITFKEFASDTGISTIFVGAIQFIDLSPPSNGSEFYYGSSDTPTAVLTAIANESQTVDFATQSIPILGSNGKINQLNPDDTVTVIFPGLLFTGIKSVFPSLSSSCSTPYNNDSKFTSNALVFNNIPINQEIFFCVTGNGHPLGLFASNYAGYGATGYGWNTLLISPGMGNSEADFTQSTNVDNEFPGVLCYTERYEFGDCEPEYFNVANLPK